MKMTVGGEEIKGINSYKFSTLPFTGERAVPEAPNMPEIVMKEHWERYDFATQFVGGKRVLDVACGSGYGSAFMAEVAESVIGGDISQEAVNFCNAKYGREKLNFSVFDIRDIPFPDNSFDVVVSFETVEHIVEGDVFLKEIARVLTDDGMLIISTPLGGPCGNHFHKAYYQRGNFESFLKKYFESVDSRYQRDGGFFEDSISPEFHNTYTGEFAVAVCRQPKKKIISNNKPMVSICIPTIRLQNLDKLKQAIKDNAGIDESEYEVLVYFDQDRIGCPKTLKYIVNEQSKGDLICFIGDDCMPGHDFLKHALDTMAELPDGWGVVGLNSQESKHAGHFLADKRMLPALNYEFFSTEYWHCFCDQELTDVALELGRYGHSEKSVITHVHPAFKRAETDDDYNRVYSPEYYDHDRKTYYQRKRARMGFKLGIGFPVIDNDVPLAFMVSFQMLEKPDYTLLVPKFATGAFYQNIAQVRNNLVDQALDEGCTHLFMIDTDQVYRDPKTIQKLLACDAMIAGGPVHRRYPPFDVILYRGTLGNYKYISDEIAYSGDVIDIDATGAGCLMFKMELFDQIQRPWFENWVDRDSGKPVGEDIGLCHKARTAGMPIRADTSIEIGHLTQFEVNRRTYELFCAMKGFKKAV